MLETSHLLNRYSDGCGGEGGLNEENLEGGHYA